MTGVDADDSEFEALLAIRASPKASLRPSTPQRHENTDTSMKKPAEAGYFSVHDHSDSVGSAPRYG